MKIIFKNKFCYLLEKAKNCHIDILSWEKIVGTRMNNFSFDYIKQYFRFDYLHMLSFVNKKYREKFLTILKSMYVINGKKYLGYMVLTKLANFYYLKSYVNIISGWRKYNITDRNIEPKFNSFVICDAKFYFSLCVKYGKKKILRYWFQCTFRYFSPDNYWLQQANNLERILSDYYTNNEIFIPKNIDGYKFCQRWKFEISNLNCMDIAIVDNQTDYIYWLLDNINFKEEELRISIIIASGLKKYSVIDKISKYFVLVSKNKILLLNTNDNDPKIVKILTNNGIIVIH